MRFFVVLWLLILSFSSPALAQQSPNFDHFSKLPVQHGGRIKPVDTFAKSYLKSFSGKESIDGLSADEWLAEALFDPAQALQRKIFRVFRPDILNLPPQEGRYYSYAQIAPALQSKSSILQKLMETEDKDWSEDQKELMRIQEASILYAQMLRSFSFLLPLNVEIPAFLKIKGDKPFTLDDYAKHRQKVEQHLKKIIAAKGDDPAKYTDEEKTVASFAFEMNVLQQAGENNVLFRVLPGQWNADGEWFSPWGLVQSGQGSPQTSSYMKVWEDMARAYLLRDAATWNKATENAADLSRQFISTTNINLELLYNNWHPLNLAMGFYLLAFIGVVFRSMNWPGPWRTAAISCLMAGGVFHAIAIALRVIILSRPPVGTLYESILFVALICVLASLAFEYLKRDGNGLLIGCISGLLLLFTAQSFAGEDTMEMLVAVLNTNFWLGTHVLCITMGYGWCLITALLAHLWLAQTALGRDADKLVFPIKTMALVSLLFTAVGTILGGIWADQSWGRFWGWDPKENGALLIVLWLIWLLHAQISGHLKRLSLMAGMAALNIIVALAWFGVNLLNTGLHSYGFITGVAAGLGFFCAGEMLVIAFLWYRIRAKKIAA